MIRGNSRRRFILASLLAGLPAFATAAEPARKTYRVAYLSTATQAIGIEGFKKAIRNQGYADGPGGNLVIDVRYADGDPARYPTLAAELVALKPDVIVTTTASAIAATMRASATIPIIMRAVADPVGSGLIQSLARPGGNVTGVSSAYADLSPKIVQIIHAIAPDATRIGVLMRDTAALRARLKELQDSARSVGVNVVALIATSPAEMESALASAARDKIRALIVLPDGPTTVNSVLIIELAAKFRLPAIYYSRGAVVQGGLVSYGPDRRDGDAKVAAYVDKVLKGAKPGDLPVQQMDKFVLAFNLKTAKVLGIKIPQELLAGAEVVE